MSTYIKEWDGKKIAILILVIIALFMMAYNARIIFIRESKKTDAISVFKKQCAQIGIASWYDTNNSIRPTASGEIYNPRALTAAHRTLPFGTQLNVINLENGRSVTVRVNDRGPYIDNRIIDLSSEAARRIGMKKPGLVAVCVQDSTKSKK